MQIEMLAINLRNLLFFQLLAILVLACDAPIIHRELLRIWKTLNTTLVRIKSYKTNHASNRFWEIDMTKFEP